MCSVCDTRRWLKAMSCGYPGCYGRPDHTKRGREVVIVRNGLIWAFCEEHRQKVLDLGITLQYINEALGDRKRRREVSLVSAKQKPEMDEEDFIKLLKG
ncbi:MAG: hypothetical protein HY226_06355 [Candidatus Vogelbacteria bacterium]|nr:hypothetical protein [Candidatus Vogelbacteria bacterium]